MEIKKLKLKTVINALKIAIMYAKTESYIAEFELLLTDVQSAIIQEVEREKTRNAYDKLVAFVTKYGLNAKKEAELRGIIKEILKES